MTGRIVFLNNQGLASFGGGVTILRHLVSDLARDHAVTVASYDPPAPGWEAVYQVTLPPAPPAGRLWRLAPMLRARHLLRVGPHETIEAADLVVALDCHFALLLRRARPRRLIYLSLSCIPRQEWFGGSGLLAFPQNAWLERSVAARANRVVVSSAIHAAELRRFTLLPGLRPVVMHPVFPAEQHVDADAITDVPTIPGAQDSDRPAQPIMATAGPPSAAQPVMTGECPPSMSLAVSTRPGTDAGLAAMGVGIADRRPGRSHHVMAGPGPALHDFAGSNTVRRGFRACARHDAVATTATLPTPEGFATPRRDHASPGMAPEGQCDRPDLIPHARFAAGVPGKDDVRLAQDDVPVIVSAGRLEPVKNFAAIIAIAERLQDLPCRFVVLGDGPLAAELRARVTAAHLEHCVCFAGSVTDIRPALARASLFLHPSRYESFGMAVFEAMLAGVPPVIARDAPVGCSEILEDGVSCCRIDGQSPDAVATMIRALLANEGRRTAMGQAARAAAEQTLAGDYVGTFRRMATRLLAGQDGRP